MGLWHGYPIGEDCHPERPWWRRYSQGWMRSGWYVSAPGLTALAWNEDTTETLQGGPGGDGPLHHGVEDLLARIDSEHPIPAPPPLCGQVWVMPNGVAGQVVGVSAAGVAAFADLLGTVSPPSWPPLGAVLVAGPTQWGTNCQWAPMGAEVTP